MPSYQYKSSSQYSHLINTLRVLIIQIYQIREHTIYNISVVLDVLMSRKYQNYPSLHHSVFKVEVDIEAEVGVRLSQSLIEFEMSWG